MFPREAGSGLSGPATPALRIQRSISRAMAEGQVTAEAVVKEVVVAEEQMNCPVRCVRRSEVRVRQRCSLAGSQQQQQTSGRMREQCWLTYLGELGSERAHGRTRACESWSVVGDGEPASQRERPLHPTADLPFRLLSTGPSAARQHPEKSDSFTYPRSKITQRPPHHPPHTHNRNHVVALARPLHHEAPLADALGPAAQQVVLRQRRIQEARSEVRKIWNTRRRPLGRRNGTMMEAED